MGLVPLNKKKPIAPYTQIGEREGSPLASCHEWKMFPHQWFPELLPEAIWGDNARFFSSQLMIYKDGHSYIAHSILRKNISDENWQELRPEHTWSGSQCPLLQVRKIPAAGTRRGLQQSSCSLLQACWNSGPLILQSLLLLLGSFIEHVSFQQASGIIPENNSTWKTPVFTGDGREELQGALRIACLLSSVLCSLALILFLP